MQVFLAAVLLLLGFAVTADAYERIVSLSPQITESLYLLDAGREVVAVTTYCRRPDEATFKEKIGSPLRPDIEKIVSLRPDLVLGSREGNPPWIIERLRRLGLNVIYFERPHNLEGLLANFLQLSETVGARERGREIVAGVRRGLTAHGQKEPYRVLWEVEAEPLMAASSSSFANDIIRLAGGSNIIDSELSYPRINREEVLLKKPDVIVLMNMGYSVQAEMERWQKYLHGTRFVVLDAYITGSPNPVTFLKAVRELEGARGQ